MFKICEQQCNECLFGPNKIVSDKRRKEILKECSTTDTHFLCHKGTIAGEEICCRGFHDNLSHVGNLHRISQRMGWVEFVSIPKNEVSHENISS